MGAEESYEWARTVALGFSSDQNTTEDSIESVRGFLNLSHSAAFLRQNRITHPPGIWKETVLN
ncbi:hypothetical protein COE25_20510 [Bacillus sp. AFS031507]|nr:hypothetical protein COE25_20510 [Bacillus sp. AFS031507]